jgi:hypothetical protein
MLVRGRRVRKALTYLDGINGAGVRVSGITFINSSIHFILLRPFYKQRCGDSCNTFCAIFFLLLYFIGMGQDRIGRDLREHNIYAFIHGGASTDFGVLFFTG